MTGYGDDGTGMKRLLFLVLLGVVGALLFRAYLYEGIYLASNSMAPTMPEGTHVVVNKWVYRVRAPKRGEVVMFQTPQNPGKGLVKRVIAVPGDVIELNKKKVYLNGTMLDEPYVEYLRLDTMLVGDNLPAIDVPEGYVFAMGDNRDFSGDSRDWKNKKGEWVPYIPIENVTGRVRIP